VVVRIFEADLQGVVIDVADGELRPDPRHVHRFELQIGRGSRGVRRQGLIEADAFRAGMNRPATMLFDDLFSGFLPIIFPLILNFYDRAAFAGD
jgi:hypothetical protein